jgi:hypothetical protein
VLCLVHRNHWWQQWQKYLYFPLCLYQAPPTWLESLHKNSIDPWDQLKDQFTSNFAGTMGRSSTRMDLEMAR